MDIKTLTMPLLSKHLTALLVLAYTGVRVLSLLTYENVLTNAIVASLLIVGFAGITIKNRLAAWVIVVAELLLHGAGHFFELGGLNLRTGFLGIFAILWLFDRLRDHSFPRPRRSIQITLAIFSIFLGIAIIRGFFFDHATKQILQDAMLFFFFFLFFPALEYPLAQSQALARVTRAYVAGSAVFSAITLAIYATGLGTLPDTYYHWFRNVASGKITDLGNHFFRIVLPEHLLVVPIILVIASYLMRTPKAKHLWIVMSLSLFTLALNFSRIYFLALAAGFIVLVYRQSLRRWLTVSALAATSLLIIFMATHSLASRGASLGLELLGVRSAGISSPTTDVSGAIRLALLPDIIQTINEHPWLGSGLATEVEFLSPVTNSVERRTQFDWGYLELIAELGTLGTLSYLALLGTILYHLGQLAYSRHSGAPDNQLPLLRGLFAGALSLFVINLTTPALFQGFGVLYFAFLAALASQMNRDHGI